MPTKRSTSARATRTTRGKTATSTSRGASARPSTTTRSKGVAKRGFAAMSLQKRREIARKGVRARRAAG